MSFRVAGGSNFLGVVASATGPFRWPSGLFVGRSGLPARLRLLMRLENLDFDLPREQIAQRPLEHRDASRLLLAVRSSGRFQDRGFRELPDLLAGNELVVLNNARVIPARLFGRRAGMRSEKPSRSTRAEHLTGKVEVLLTRQVGDDAWEALV